MSENLVILILGTLIILSTYGLLTYPFTKAAFPGLIWGVVNGAALLLVSPVDATISIAEYGLPSLNVAFQLLFGPLGKIFGCITLVCCLYQIVKLRHHETGKII